MYKSCISHKKEEKQKYPSSIAYNLLSPPYNPKQKMRGYFNSNLPKFQPINLYSTCLSPFQNDKNLSVKNISSPDDKVSQNLMNKFSDHQKNINSKILLSPNTTNSDLTAASLTSQQSNESILSNNTNTTVYIPTSFQTGNYQMCEMQKGHKYTYSMVNPQINMNNYYNPNNMFINGNYSNMNINCFKGNQVYINPKLSKSGQNMNQIGIMNNFNKFSGKNNKKLNRNNINNGDKEKINSNNFASNNSSKSGSSSNKTNSDSCKISSSNNSNNSNALGSSQNLSLKSKNSKNFGNPQRKKYFNKFNSAKENNTNSENTVILTLKIKVAKDDYRVFNLKKYDDLFISLEKFFDLNKIEQSLVKPIVTKIFTALNKIFWLLNNKIGIYDQEYLNSLYKLWMKNNEKIPKRNQENKNKSKEDSNNSTISSSDSTDENKKHKRLLSNSFQNMDNLSEDEKQNTVKSI